MLFYKNDIYIYIDAEELNNSEAFSHFYNETMKPCNVNSVLTVID